MADAIDVAKLLSGQGIEDARKAIESGEASFKVYAFPRPRLRIRSSKRRIIRLDEGKIARLEYSLVRTGIDAASKGARIVFEDFAKLVGDYKAAAAYLAFLSRSGFVAFTNERDAQMIYIAATALSQKTYERAVARVLRAEFVIDTERVLSLPSDTVFCAYRDGVLGCKYLVTNCSRSQARAQIRGAFDALMR